MEGLISIPEFMAYMKTEGLVLVRADELEAAKYAQLREMQRRYMKRKSLMICEVIEAKLLRVQSSQGIRHWIKEGKILPTEAYQDTNKVWWVMTAAIKRLGYAE
jgi:hypothetical protein